LRLDRRRLRPAFLGHISRNSGLWDPKRFYTVRER